MRITVPDLEREPVEFDEHLHPEAIEFGFDVQQVGVLDAAGRADLIEEHRGPKQVVPDIRLRAGFQGNFEVPCARCVEPVAYPLQSDFDLIFRPLGVDGNAPERAISTDETEIGYYEDDGLVLEDVLREQVLLSLPAKTLCSADCKGLCPRCGHNLNSEPCNCRESSPDPRWSALSDLSSRVRS